MKIDYNNRRFKAVENSPNGELDSSTIFHYQQNGQTLTCDYNGTSILSGHLLGTVLSDGTIEMVYHQMNADGEIQTGKCTSKPTILSNGKIRLIEKWEWTSGDYSKGTSVLEEV